MTLRLFRQNLPVIPDRFQGGLRSGPAVPSALFPEPAELLSQSNTGGQAQFTDAQSAGARFPGWPGRAGTPATFQGWFEPAGKSPSGAANRSATCCAVKTSATVCRLWQHQLLMATRCSCPDQEFIERSQRTGGRESLSSEVGPAEIGGRRETVTVGSPTGGALRSSRCQVSNWTRPGKATPVYEARGRSPDACGIASHLASEAGTTDQIPGQRDRRGFCGTAWNEAGKAARRRRGRIIDHSR
jgi:hypothetical protein